MMMENPTTCESSFPFDPLSQGYDSINSSLICPSEPNPTPQKPNNERIGSIKSLNINDQEHFPSLSMALPLSDYTPCTNHYVSAANQELGLFIYDRDVQEDLRLPFLEAYELLYSNVVYIGQWKDGKRHGRGEQYWPDGLKYEGYWQDDEMTGKGRLISAEGEIYEGDFLNGLYHGQGSIIFENMEGNTYGAENDFSFEFRNRYSGSWRNHVPDGKGEYENWDGTKYKGEYKNGRLEGKGQSENPDGSRYIGDFVEGKKQGFGEFFWVDGSKYIGEYFDGLRHGHGTMEEVDGSRYEGSWNSGIQHGQGEYTYPDGGKYKGDFNDGHQEGYGEYEWINGCRFIGNWKNYMRHGYGQFIDIKGQEKFGEWNEDNLVRYLTN